MGITQSAGTEHNVYWDLKDNLGNVFEDNIGEVLISELKVHLNRDVTIDQTDRTNDGGKDFIVEFSCESLSLFDIAFSKGDKDKSVIYIECKSTNSDSPLRREKVVPSIVNARKNKIDYYVLLTNSKISPLDYYEEEKLLRDKNIEFVLIDQYLLARFLKSKNYQIFGEIPFYKGNDDFYAEYQVYTDESDDNKYNIYFNFRNYSKHNRMFTISLLTDVNWNTKENSFSFTIDSNCTYSKKISLICDCKNNYKTLVFKIESGKFESYLNIKGINLRESYTPPFTGKYHKRIVKDIFNNIIRSDSNKLFCLWGETGIGKTRIVHELSKKIKGSYFDMLECSLKKDNIKAIREIQNFLIDKKYISSDVIRKYPNDLYNIVICSDNLIKKAIIFIDDFHNSSRKLIEQIKKLNKHDSPVILILCGRTDYTEGNTAYYSFVQWTFRSLEVKKCVWDVKPLYPSETKKLIRSMINEIPEEAINTIYLRSGNNPLYIVQFTEYLLDEKIAYIVNRNTIGIIEPATFTTHAYIPDEITDIYKKRIAYLKKTGVKDGIDYLKFLFILTVFNGQMPVVIAEQYYDQNGLITNFLHERAFIFKRNNYYRFYHESLMIYIQELLTSTSTYKKAIAEYILKQPEALLNLSSYTKGRMYLWNDKTNKALEIFSPIMLSIKKFKNLSNIDIDTSIYEYLDDILQIVKDKPEYYSIAKKTINSKIYITLHHYIPTNATIECNKCLDYIASSPVLSKDKKLIYSILAQKAHSLLSSGKNLEGELILKELQVKWLVSEKDFESQTTFDIMDRLCAISIKFNCYSMAHDYSKLELDIAEKSRDNSLEIIAHRTRSKLFYLNNLFECRKSLDKVDKLLEENPSDRIKINNRIYSTIVDLTYNTSGEYDEIIHNAEELTDTSFKKELNRAIIQSNMVLAAAYLKRGTFMDFKSAKEKVIIAINYSIRFGIPSYMWQLYNLLAIIDTRLGAHSNKIKRHFETAFDILNKQNLFYIGRNKLCYSNVLVISNFGFFLRRYSFQKSFNSKMSMLTYCEVKTISKSAELKNRKLSKNELAVLYEKALNKELLFSESNSTKLLRDNETGYFIALT